jgi:hypothetical protein
VLNGQVDAVLPGPAAGTVYVSGAFTTVNGVKSRGITLLNLSNGSIVSGFTPPVLNGIVEAMRSSGGRLYITGTFTTAGSVTHDGLATLNAATGALDPFMDVQLTGHHSYNGTGADGPVGGRAMDISPDGTRAIVVGDFKDANGTVHDQIVMLDLTGSSAVVDPNWNTDAFSGACDSAAFDTYVEDVDFSPDGSYFAIAATGGGGISDNTDGTRSLCDSASRWSTTDTGTDVQPTWVDYTGNDSFWSVAVTGTAIYVGGHERWVNNPNGSDHAAAGATARPGMAALDPASGLPLAWNPGRNPRGAGAYALLATSSGLYVGSDTNYIGDFKYKRDEIAFFPLAGGYTPASTATTSLPANRQRADLDLRPEQHRSGRGVPQRPEQHGQLRPGQQRRRHGACQHAERDLQHGAVEPDRQPADDLELPGRRWHAGGGPAVLRQPLARHQPAGPAGVRRLPQRH